MTVLKILIAEDDISIGELLSEMLDGMGYTVCAVEVGDEDAIAAAALHRPDILIVDAGLGDGSGIVVVEAILRLGFVPHIFMSGNARELRSLKPDAVILEKPFRQSELRDALVSALAAVPVSSS